MNKSKTIWIINQYASTRETGFGGRHYYLAEELAKLGYRVCVIAAAYSHLLRNPPQYNNDFYIQNISARFDFVWVKVPRYGEAHSKKRVFNWFYFAWKLQQLPRHLQIPPDVVLYSSPSLIGYIGAEKLAKGLQAKLVFEVRDIWPLTLIEVGGYSPKHPFIRMLQSIENRAYRNSDLVLSNLKYAVKHMQQHGLNPQKFSWIPNGFSLAEVSQAEPLPPAIVQQIPISKFIVGYAGTIGVSNALDTLIQAAARLTNRADIAFVLVGSGKEKAELQNQVKLLNLNNVFFIDAIPKIQIQSMLAKFDVCYLGLTADPLFHFGVSPNKLFDYLYAGKPILYAIDSGEFKPIDDFKAGISIGAQDIEATVDAILKLYETPISILKAMGENSRKSAMAYFEYGYLAKKMANILFADQV